MIRVLVVDDQDLLRAGLRMILESDSDLTVVGEAADGLTAIAEVKRSTPDVVLMDIRMPKLDGLGATSEISKMCPVVILTTFSEPEILLGALEAGASGFLLKDAPGAEIIGGVKAVASGGASFSPGVTPSLLSQVARRRVVDKVLLDRANGLSERELAVLRVLSEGLTNSEIAASMYISEATVKTHISHILSKLELRDRTQLALFAVRSGLLP